MTEQEIPLNHKIELAFRSLDSRAYPADTFIHHAETHLEFFHAGGLVAVFHRLTATASAPEEFRSSKDLHAALVSAGFSIPRFSLRETVGADGVARHTSTFGFDLPLHETTLQDLEKARRNLLAARIDRGLRRAFNELSLAESLAAPLANDPQETAALAQMQMLAVRALGK